MNNRIEIYDTTLRDGSQGQGVSFSVADKLRIAERLDAFGVHYIEGGWPGIESQGHRVLRAGQAPDVHARAARRVRLDAAQGHDRCGATIRCGCSSTPTRRSSRSSARRGCCTSREVLQTTPDENLAMIEDTVRLLKQHGKFVVYDAEHCVRRLQGRTGVRARDLAGRRARRRRRRHAVRHQRRIAAGRDRGDHARRSARTLKTALGIHTHDDIGLGVANALAALEAGATHVQGTINGYGERTGNCNLTS